MLVMLDFFSYTPTVCMKHAKNQQYNFNNRETIRILIQKSDIKRTHINYYISYRREISKSVLAL